MIQIRRITDTAVSVVDRPSFLVRLVSKRQAVDYLAFLVKMKDGETQWCNARNNRPVSDEVRAAILRELAKPVVVPCG